MSQVKSTFEYHSKGNNLSPFQVYLKYTNEKEITSQKVADLISENISKPDFKILDIGTGNGEFIQLILNKLSKDYESIELDLLEPSVDLIEELKVNIKDLNRKINPKIIHNNWEEFNIAAKYDFIIASHLYHFPKDRYFDDLFKMINFLNDKGKLIFVMREADDPYEFKMTFKPILNNNNDYKARLINEALDIFKQIDKSKIQLKIEYYTAKNILNIPLEDNFEDTVSIVEFYLNYKWEEINDSLRNQIIEFLKNKDSQFKQIEGIAVIFKV